MFKETKSKVCRKYIIICTGVQSVLKWYNIFADIIPGTAERIFHTQYNILHCYSSSIRNQHTKTF